MPNVVKGSKQEKMVVVPYRPWRRFVSIFAVAALLAGVGFAAYRLGASDSFTSDIQLNQLSMRISELELENADLRKQVVTLERASVMDRQANDEIQSTIAGLREYISKLEQDNAFYRQAMTSEFEDVGLVVGEMDLQSTDVPGRYRYKLVMRQEEADGQYLTGHVNVDVIGELDGEKTVVPLMDLSEEQDALEIKLRFRYFQNIEGELELPEGFKPDQIVINAMATAPMAKSVSRSISWVVEGE